MEIAGKVLFGILKPIFGFIFGLLTPLIIWIGLPIAVLWFVYRIWEWSLQLKQETVDSSNSRIILPENFRNETDSEAVGQMIYNVAEAINDPETYVKFLVFVYRIKKEVLKLLEINSLEDLAIYLLKKSLKSQVFKDKVISIIQNKTS